MKKLLLFCAVVALMATFVACEKNEGIDLHSELASQGLNDHLLRRWIY